jgi:hypothetical protein
VQTSVADVPTLVSRTGYSGELGFELYYPRDYALHMWDALTAAGARPCGLGALRSTRMEKKYPLYGLDVSETTSPLEAGLTWAVDLDAGSFVGRDALARQRDEGISRLLTGIELPDLSRVPAAGEARSNMHVGGRPEATTLTRREQEICAALGPELKRRGLIFTGIDVIGGQLTEINVTSPTGIQEVNALEGVRLHDLRHSFAVLRLLLWCEQGVDLSAKLPLLATYLGHVDLSSSQRYLQLTQDLTGEITRRHQARFGYLIKEGVTDERTNAR